MKKDCFNITPKIFTG